MRIEHFKTYTLLHTWAGIIAGLLLYICFVAGALSMFEEPLDRWALQTNASLPPIAAEKYDQLIQQVFTEYPESKRNMTVSLPHAQPHRDHRAPSTHA